MRQNYFTPEEDQFIKDNYGSETFTDIGKALSRQPKVIQARAILLGIHTPRTQKRKATAQAKTPESMDRALVIGAKNSEKLDTAILANFSPRQLMEELRSRGYDGLITYTETKEYRIKLSEI